MLQLEHTDTFGGEANYCWVRRAYMANPPEKRRTLVRKIKAWAGQMILTQGALLRVDRRLVVAEPPGAPLVGANPFD